MVLMSGTEKFFLRRATINATRAGVLEVIGLQAAHGRGGAACVEDQAEEGALDGAVELSHRYISDRFLPDKAIDLVDEACATIRTEMDSMPAELDEVTRRVMQLEIEEAALKKEKDLASQERLKTLRKELADHRSAGHLRPREGHHTSAGGARMGFHGRARSRAQRMAAPRDRDRRGQALRLEPRGGHQVRLAVRKPSVSAVDIHFGPTEASGRGPLGRLGKNVPGPC